MKGLLVSLIIFAGYVVLSATACHVLRLKRHLHVFALLTLPCVAGYFALYHLTPPDFYFLPPSWRCATPWFDQGYGLIVFLLNCHSFVDGFFASCTGFSVSMLMIILKAEGRGITTGAMVEKFKTPEGTDRIYGWRLPYLEAKGHITRDPVTHRYSLTGKGRLVATVAWWAKRALNLGDGG